MRDIKFRVWDNVDYMSSPFTLQDIQQRKIQFTSDCVVMQYTGLKDRSGKEIYEGDIMDYGAERYFPITYKKNVFGLKSPVGDWHSGCWLDLSKFEIIGNIYEHSYLLLNEPTTN